MQYTKGEFHTFRTITKIHLGAISENLMEGEEVDFDGFTMRRGGDTHSMHSLRGAVKVGWLVHLNAAETQYVPQPAGVVVHRADGMNNDEIGLTMLSEENVNVGTIQEVRPQGAPPTHRATKAGELHTQANDAEGVVVARFKSAAKQEAVMVGKDDRRVVQTLDNKSKAEVEKIARPVATGDVQEPLGGESLEELLPEAASTGTPDPGVVKDGERVGTASKTIIQASSLGLIQQFIPGFGWDLNVQWRKRAKIAVDQYSQIPAVINYIMSVETDAVKREITKRLNA